MGRVIDITDKLSFDENPSLIIRGEIYEVNADAKTVLEIMGSFSNMPEIEASLTAYEKMFKEKERERIDSLNLPFKDLMVIIESAMHMITGEDAGEVKTPTMT